ncbi:DNA translocase FtsK 4TM domain-containing protein [Gemmobacter sp. JM10B15]|uniref:DNA translocase FtsK n=2 Tax=Gemmobacter denitrificans TaxID=3123040 RepID=A0ABU8BTM6_9RHOB
MRQREPLIDPNTQAALERRARELIGIGLAVLALVFVVMLGSYSPEDPGWLAASDAPVQNWLGRIGASVADTLMLVVGKGAWSIPLILAVWAGRFITHRGADRAAGRVVFALIAVAMCAVFAATFVPDPDWPHRFGLGGLFGETVLGSMINMASVQASFGLVMLSLLTGLAALAMLLFVTGFDREELEALRHAGAIGMVRGYAALMALLGQGGASAARAALALQTRHAEKRAARAEMQMEQLAAPAPMAIPRPAQMAAPAMGAAPRGRVIRAEAPLPPLAEPVVEDWVEPAEPYAEFEAPVEMAPAPRRKEGFLDRLRRVVEPDPEPELFKAPLPDQTEVTDSPTEDRIKARISDVIKARVRQGIGVAAPQPHMTPLQAAIARREPALSRRASAEPATRLEPPVTAAAALPADAARSLSAVSAAVASAAARAAAAQAQLARHVADMPVELAPATPVLAPAPMPRPAPKPVAAMQAPMVLSPKAAPKLAAPLMTPRKMAPIQVQAFDPAQMEGPVALADDSGLPVPQLDRPAPLRRPLAPMAAAPVASPAPQAMSAPALSAPPRMAAPQPLAALPRSGLAGKAAGNTVGFRAEPPVMARPAPSRIEPARAEPARPEMVRSEPQPPMAAPMDASADWDALADAALASDAEALPADWPAEDDFADSHVPAPVPAFALQGTTARKVVQHPVKKPLQPSARAVAETQPRLRFEDQMAQAYELPPLSLLTSASTVQRHTLSDEALEENARMLESVLDDYGVKGEIVSVRPGPVVTMYELEPAPGLKASRVIGLADDIARSMSALSARVSTVPGRTVIGIELPNATREKVVLREILSARDFGDSAMRLPLALGKDIGGDPVVANLAKMPHLLIAGTTGSGKSVAINTMILSLLYKLTPEECRLIMIDPKMLELSVYDGIPHLLSPVVTDPKKAVVALKWVVGEMEERYRKMSKMGVRNIDGYNGRVREAVAAGEMFKRTIQTGFDEDTGEPVFETEEFAPEPFPYIVVIVDEMADLMMVAGKEIEACIQRLAQMARASGIHLIMATQRPSVDVITGTIKANFPTRISFQVTSKIDSRTILGEMGAEQLLGMGDMLYMGNGQRITRIHGPFVSDEEVEEVVTHLKSFGPPSYMSGVVEGPEDDVASDIDAVLGLNTGGNTDGEDALYDQAVAIVAKDRKCSTSYIQRKLGIGYNKAARLVEQMEEQGVVTPANHVGKREILIPEA